MLSVLLSLIPGRSILYALAAAALAGLIAWHWAHEAAQRQAAVTAALAASNARWQAALDKANAETQIALTAAQGRADDAAHAAEATEAKLNDAQTRLEAANADLPTPPSCGLDRARVRLLDGLR